MKVFCFRYPRNAVTDMLISLLCVFVIMLILINADYREDLLCGSPVNSIRSFIEDNGWEIDIGGGSCKEITLPEVFDETYRDYSALQKSQGFSFDDYKGKRVTVYTYPVVNYPEYENSDSIFINIFLYDNTVIGADVLCTAIDGFITGAVRNVSNQA